MNIFERAVRAKLRFASSKGNLNTEQLFDLTLTQLDKIARSVNAELKASGEESFIETNQSKEQVTLTLKLEILKSIIASKQASIKAAETREANATKRRRLEEVLARKQDAALEEMSEDEIQAELEKLG